MADESTKQIAHRDIARSKAIIKKHQRKIDAWQVILEEDEAESPSTRPSDIVRLDMDSRPRKLGITAAVKTVLPQFGGKEFSAPTIEEKLSESGIMPDINNPRMRISMVLKRLEKQGMVERTYGPSTGTEPHRFRLIEEKWDLDDLLAEYNRGAQEDP